MARKIEIARDLFKGLKAAGELGEEVTFKDWYAQNKETIVETTVTTEEVVQAGEQVGEAAVQVAEATEEVVSKMDICRKIFNEARASGSLVRKDVMKRFMEEAGCSKPCANTYYQNLREKAGLVTHTA